MSKSGKMIILGPSGSGKDFLVSKLKEKDLVFCVKHTTRPIRDKEINGVNYYFTSNDDFLEMIKNKDFITYQKFITKTDDGERNIWYYGISKNEFDKSNLFIMTPVEYNSLNLSEKERNNYFVVYLDIDKSIREERIKNRMDNNDSIERRMNSDEIDFYEFDDFDLKITDPEFEPDDIYYLMD